MRVHLSIADKADGSTAAVRDGTGPGIGPVRIAAGIAVLALSLGACSPMKTDPTVVGSIINDGYRTRHPILLTESAETIDIPVGTQSSVLTERMAHAVRVFAEDARRRGATGVTILVPSGSRNEASAYRMSRQIAAALREGGVPQTAVTQAPYRVDDAGADAPIRIAYARIKAMVPHACGVWPDAVAVAKFQNQDDYEFGCSTQTNVAAMVADPSDLVTPAAVDPVDGTRRTKVITNYRAGTTTKAETGAKTQTIANSISGGS